MGLILLIIMIFLKNRLGWYALFVDKLFMIFDAKNTEIDSLYSASDMEIFNDKSLLPGVEIKMRAFYGTKNPVVFPTGFH